MAFIIQKYGGTSVQTPEKIKQVSHRIAYTVSQGHQVLVVISAMGDTTDTLLKLAYEVSSDPEPRELDMLLSVGERISMALLSMALRDHGYFSISFTGSQSGIITNTCHQKARIQKIIPDRVTSIWSRFSPKAIPIIAGFQGVSLEKEITTLGRGGSDTTAVALASALKADCCEIFTDVSGVYSADPRQVPDAVLLKEIPSDQMIELSFLGAGVLHPRSVELAREYNVPLSVKKNDEYDTGTLLIHEERGKTMENKKITGITSDPEKFFIQITLADSGGSTLWKEIAEKNLDIFFPHQQERSLFFFSHCSDLSPWSLFLECKKKEKEINDFILWRNLCPVGLVGYRFSQDPKMIFSIIDLLKEKNISLFSFFSSSLSLTLVIFKEHVDQVVFLLHQSFILEDIG